MGTFKVLTVHTVERGSVAFSPPPTDGNLVNACLLLGGL